MVSCPMTKFHKFQFLLVITVYHVVFPLNPCFVSLRKDNDVSMGTNKGKVSEDSKIKL